MSIDHPNGEMEGGERVREMVDMWLHSYATPVMFPS